MKLKSLLLSSLVVMSIASTASYADMKLNPEISEPVIALMPAFQKIKGDLKLNAEQKKTIDAWVVAAPLKREELRDKSLAIREELREALLSRASRIERDRLKQELADVNRSLIEMSSLCARMLNNTLTKEQYDKVVAQYRSTADAKS